MTGDRYDGLRLSGETICKLMRKHGLTIKALAQKWEITQKRVREVRRIGVSGFSADEWHYLITGAWITQPPFSHRRN